MSSIEKVVIGIYPSIHSKVSQHQPTDLYVVAYLEFPIVSQSMKRCRLQINSYRHEDECFLGIWKGLDLGTGNSWWLRPLFLFLHVNFHSWVWLMMENSVSVCDCSSFLYHYIIYLFSLWSNFEFAVQIFCICLIWIFPFRQSVSFGSHHIRKEARSNFLFGIQRKDWHWN